MNPWKEAILETDPDLDVEIWPRVEKNERVTFAVVWNQPPNVLNSYPNLGVVSSLGAGVDHLISDKTLPEKVKVTRVVIPSLKEQISDYVLNAVMNYRFNTATYVDQKRIGQWNPIDPIQKADLTVGVMGLGEMGQSIIERLQLNGYKVFGWSRSGSQVGNTVCYGGDQFDDFLRRTNILVNALPLTSETNGILDLEVFKKLTSHSYLINVGRGAHLIEEDLIYALDTDALQGACLDVFEEEPLPTHHSFWNRPKIMVTPHVAAITDPKEAAKVIVENYKLSLSGMSLMYEVDRGKGY
tara:strand:- start:88843 stop:89736 length:894 start_codon:yes stop_codon:yes gene_type:complete